ncbi:MAG: EAL domain-containing protein [Acidimicrobiales bacterium]|nr:EAL domain-containing protein [Acidimicrobiales bacterium]
MAVVGGQVRRGLEDLWNGGTNRPDPLGPDQERMVQLRRAQVVALLAPLANLAHLVSIAITGALLLPREAGWFVPAWTAATAGVAINSVRVWLPRRTSEEIDVLALRGLHLESLAFATLYGAALWRCLAVAGPSQAAGLLATIAGVLGAGAIQMSVYRAVAYSWVWMHVVALSVGILLGDPAYRLLAVQLVVYGSALSLAITYLSASFERRCRAELAAEAERTVVRVLLDDLDGGARDWLWTLDRRERLQSVSERFGRSAGRAPAALEGRSIEELLALLGSDRAEGGRAAADRLRAVLAQGVPFRDLEVPVLVAGEVRWWAWSGRPLRAPLGEGWSGVCSDVTDERRRAAEILHLATVDSLTGLANRHRFGDELDAELAAGPLGLGIVDLDNFKEVNDTLGHPVGDELLVEVAGRLVAAASSGGARCARIGGDEFAIVLPGHDPAQIEADLRRIARSLRHPFTVAGAHLRISGCVGFALAPHDAEDATALLRLADLALYEAKAEGRAVVQRYHPAMGDRAELRAAVRRELGLALARHELEVWYQPQLDLASGRTVGVEALVRWRHPERGLIPPDAFIPVAEETGLIHELGADVLRMALDVLAQLPADVVVAVNVSAAQLVAPGLPARVARELAARGLPAARLVLEVTESQLVDELAVSRLREIRATGVRISVDDFGTGYSSFASLRSLPIDEVKVDRSFVAALDDRALVDPVRRGAEPGAVIVAAILEVASALSLRTVAEGIETAAQGEVLAAMECQLGQGYHFARPCSAAELLARAELRPPGREEAEAISPDRAGAG